MKRAALLACLWFLPLSSQGTMVRYTLTLDGGAATALAHSFVTTSTTFVPPVLSGANEFGAAPSHLTLNLPSSRGPLDTFGFELLYADGSAYLALGGLELPWLSEFGTYELPLTLFGEPAYFTSAADYRAPVPEPASIVALGTAFLTIFLRKRGRATPSFKDREEANGQRYR
jgi:hypothetical protein